MKPYTFILASAVVLLLVSCSLFVFYPKNVQLPSHFHYLETEDALPASFSSAPEYQEYVNITPETLHLYENSWIDCWKDTDVVRLLSNETCRQLWLTHIQIERPERILRMKKVAVATKGGMELTFENAEVKAYWKPCRRAQGEKKSDDENYESEIAAFHIDRLVGYKRTPPAVGVTLNKSVFEKLSNNSDPEVVQEGYIDSYFKYCNNSAYSGKETEINGAMLGWSRFPSKEFPSVVHQLLPTTPTHNMTAYSRIDVDKSPSRLIMESIRLSMFSILLGYEKHGRNVFIMLSEEYGPPGVLINIDNDRTSYDRMKWHPAKEYTICNLCKFPELPLKRLTYWYYHRKNTRCGLGEALREALHGDPLHVGFSGTEVETINARLDFLVEECIAECARIYGIRGIVYQDPTDA